MVLTCEKFNQQHESEEDGSSLSEQRLRLKNLHFGPEEWYGCWSIQPMSYFHHMLPDTSHKTARLCQTSECYNFALIDQTPTRLRSTFVSFYKAKWLQKNK